MTQTSCGRCMAMGSLLYHRTMEKHRDSPVALKKRCATCGKMEARNHRAYCPPCEGARRKVSSRTLVCEASAEPHEWTQTAPGKGRPPKACPEHRDDWKTDRIAQWNSANQARRRAEKMDHDVEPEKGLSWRTVAVRDGMGCAYCGVTTIWKHEDRKLWPTLDHVIPLSKGGSHTQDNAVLACFSCNAKKGNRSRDVADFPF